MLRRKVIGAFGYDTINIRAYRPRASFGVFHTNILLYLLSAGCLKCDLVSEQHAVIRAYAHGVRSTMREEGN
jgi:hypothetical protein